MNYHFDNKNGIKLLELSAISSTGVAEAFFTTRDGGISSGACGRMNCNIYKKQDIENGRENFRLVCKALNIDPGMVITNRLIYFTDIVRCVTKKDIVNIYDESLSSHADGLVTDDPDITLFLYAADCAIVLLADSKKRVIGALHAGWKGSLIPIIENTVDAMCKNYGCCKENIVAQICPSIGKCCFETGEDVAEQFVDAGFEDFKYYINGRPHIDLNGVNRMRLIKAGLKPVNIYNTDICTCCHPELFHSYRRGPVNEKGIHLNGMNGVFLRLK